MDLWCGNLTSSVSSILLRDCIANLALIVPGILILTVGGVFFLIVWCGSRSPCDVTNAPKWVRYPGHSLRWVLTFFLICVQMLEITEGILVQTLWSAEPVLHLYVPGILSILAYLASLLFYNITETFNNPRWLVSGLLFWLGEVIVRAWRVSSLYEERLTPDHVRVPLSWVILTLSLLLLAVDVNLLRSQKYLARNIKLLKTAEELQDLIYVHPYTNFLSRATWHWLNPILRQGYQEPLQLEDLGKLPETEKSEVNFHQFKKALDEEKQHAVKNNSKLSLWKCYLRTYWPQLFVAGLYRLIGILMILVGPFCLDGIVNYVIEVVDGKNSTVTDHRKTAMTSYEYFTNGYVLAVLALLATLMQGTCFQNSFYLCVRQGIRLKGAIQSLVFEKTLRLSLFSIGEGKLTQGQVINHMAVDPMHLFYLFYYVHFSWSLPLEVILIFVVLYIQLGVSALVGASLLLLLVPAQYFIGRILATTKKAALEEADTRLKKSNELLQSIKLLKLYAWEAIFSRSIFNTRRKELRLLFKAAFMRVLSIFITDGAPVAATMFTFVIYPFVEDQPLKTGKVFSALALFNILGLPLYLVTMIINIMSHSKVSTDRLAEFFMAPEIEGKKGEQPALLEQCPSVLVKSPKKDFIDVTKDVKHDTMSENPLIENGQTSPPGGQSALVLPSSALLPGIALDVKGGNFSWDITGSDQVLHDINFSIPEGELTVLIGTVGSGKSSVLSAVLGEMTTVSGVVTWKENLSVAYGGQKAWLMNATVQENILYGKAYDKERYEKMLDICALRLDLDTLPAGDQTEIGEKGINLSGGQKQRISIARTIYSGADIVILDDPLSALDAHVGSHIFQSAIQEYLKDNGKTVILVTHYLQYLSHAKQVLHIDNGRIAHQGSLDEIQKDNPDIVSQWTSIIQHNRNAADEAEKAVGCPIIEIGQVSPTVLSPPSGSLLGLEPRSGPSVYSLDYLGLHDDLDTYIQLSRSRGSIVSANFPGLDQSQLLDMGKSAGIAKDQEKGKLIQAEEHSTGSVKAHVYVTYIKEATVILSFMMLSCYCIRQALRMGTDYWLAEWSEASEAAQRYASLSNGYNSTISPYLTAKAEAYVMEDYLRGFVGLCVGGIVLTFIGILFLEIMCLNAAKNLHKDMLKTVVKAPMRFFDTTPIGRIVNRISGDTNIIDEKMAVTLDGVLFSALYVLGGVIMNAVSTPYFLIPAFPLVALYLLIQRFYIASSRELQRLDSITKSPILSHFAETLGGLSTIRAFRSQTRFQTQNFKNIDTNNTAILYLHTSNVWMAIRLDYLGSGIVFTAATCSLTSGIYGIVSPGIVGLAVAYALMIAGFVNYMMRTVSEAEMFFTSVERVSQFAELKTEPLSWEEKDDNVPDQWPSKGKIELRSVSLRYDPKLEPVVSGVNLTIAAGEKVGICGRTGSGKSSLTLGLFRMIDICDGTILIDDIDVCCISLHQLRSRLSIIPQDPVLFEGSIRFNLDPDNTKSDEELWQALDIAQLKTLISSLPEKLESVVTEGGENFSLGQRQLVCIARALLRQSQILIMDEATASIDMETDSIIQSVIQTAFKDKTVITIAHRVATILKCDRIVVLADGEVMESDSPQNLLANADSMFASLVRENK